MQAMRARWKMDDKQTELLRMVSVWREKHDLRPSEVVSYLIDTAIGLAPEKHVEWIGDVRSNWIERGGPNLVDDK